MNFLTREGRSGHVEGRGGQRALPGSYVVALVGLAVAASVAMPSTASAIPAFARKYGTSCTTCHSIYPRLNPFGEAFRRNGFRFPGADADFVKQEPLALGSEAYKKVFPNAVWPASIPQNLPFAFGVNGTLSLHPMSQSAGADSDGGAPVVFDHIVEEAHLWGGGNLSETVTYFAELTANSAGLSIEHALVLFNDLVGPAHALNLTVGSFVPTLSSFGPHSSYLADGRLTSANMTAIFGGAAGVDSSWATLNNSNGFELTGTAEGSLNYSVGINQGTNAFSRAPDNVYGHVGYKIGGVRLDGENGSAVPDAMKPWAETALTIDVYGFHSSSRYGTVLARDNANVAGGALRGQLGSLELDCGMSYESHDNVNAAGLKATSFQQFGELSYVVYPWLVPAVRVENATVSPDGGTSVSDMRIMPGVAALILPNMKLTLVADIEHADGAPPGGWDGVGGMAAGKVKADVQAITLGMAYAY